MRWSLQSTPNALWVGCVKVSALGSGSWIFAGVGPKLLLLFIALLSTLRQHKSLYLAYSPFKKSNKKDITLKRAESGP